MQRQLEAKRTIAAKKEFQVLQPLVRVFCHITTILINSPPTDHSIGTTPETVFCQKHSHHICMRAVSGDKNENTSGKRLANAPSMGAPQHASHMFGARQSACCAYSHRGNTSNASRPFKAPAGANKAKRSTLVDSGRNVAVQRQSEGFQAGEDVCLLPQVECNAIEMLLADSMPHTVCRACMTVELYEWNCMTVESNHSKIQSLGSVLSASATHARVFRVEGCSCQKLWQRGKLLEWMLCGRACMIHSLSHQGYRRVQLPS
jgi:hypothetical protein